ncbi:MAG TPA: hypothetical protein PLB55_14750 [Prosthecobacter sp.]|nr:hypothetical protein [Prosthecobacter sp.]
MKSSRHIFITTALLATLCLCTAQAGRVSLLIKGSKMALKGGVKEATDQIGKKVAKLAEEKLATRYGKSALEKADLLAASKKLPRDTVLRLLGDHGDVLARHGFSEEAMQFALRHRGPGVFFLRHPQLFDALKKSVNLDNLDPKVVTQAWRWGDDKAIGGSLQRLRESLTKAGMNNGRTRDFCEDLFAARAPTGRIPGLPKGTQLISGHVGEARQGIDFLRAQNGRIHVMEFGTGRKPEAGELDWQRIRTNLADFLEQQDTNARINLRGQGFPNELVTNPARLRDPSFPIEKFVQREIYAPELDTSELLRAGRDIIAHRLN